MDDSRWPREMVPLSLIFFSAPAGSAAKVAAETASPEMQRAVSRRRVGMNGSFYRCEVRGLRRGVRIPGLVIGRLRHDVAPMCYIAVNCFKGDGPCPPP